MKKVIVLTIVFISIGVGCYAQGRQQQLGTQIGQLAQREIDLEANINDIHDARIEAIGMLKERQMADSEISTLQDKINELEVKDDKKEVTKQD